jgi:hypothetical protein
MCDGLQIYLGRKTEIGTRIAVLNGFRGFQGLVVF